MMDETRLIGAARGKASAGTPEPGAGNLLLGAMAAAERARLRPMMARIELVRGAMLYAPGDWIDQIYFPESGVVSLAAEAPDGRRTEVVAVGREGMVGLTALLGARTASRHALVQVAGHAARLPVTALRAAADGQYGLRDLIRRYTLTRLIQAERNSVCHALHPLRQRTARWLLAMRDRAGPGFAITQEVIAQMLGARRPTVNAVLRELRAEGLIRQARGAVAVADAEGLEAVACTCRGMVRNAYRGVLPGAFD